jgi:hypothetical protein
MVPPGLRPAPSPARPPVLLGRAGRCGIRRTRKPSRVDLLHVGCHGFGGLRVGLGMRLGVSVRQLTRMPHDNTERLRDNSAIAVFDLDLPNHALPMPAARRFGLRPARFLSEARQGGWLTPPGCECLPNGTGTRDSCHEPDRALQTPAQGTATLGLAVCDNPAHALKAQRQTCFDCHGRFHTITAVASAHADTEGQPALSPHAQTQEHVLEVVAPILAVPGGRPGGSGSLRLVRIRPLERHGRGVLREPGGRNGVDRECFQRQRAQHFLEVGGKQRIEDVPPPVIMERGPCEPWLQQGHPAPFCQPLPHLGQGMMPIQHRQDQGFDPTPGRKLMPWVRRHEVVNHGGPLQAPSDAQDQRYMRDGINLLHGYGHTAPPVSSRLGSIIAERSLRQQQVSRLTQKSRGST